MKTRPINYRQHPDWESFEKKSLESAKVLRNNYHFYFSGECYRVGDIVTCLKKKNDLVKQKFTVYYDEKGVYFVIFRRMDIGVEYITFESNSINKHRGYAYKLIRDINK